MKTTNKITLTLNGNQVLLDVDRAIELGLIEDVKKDLIDRKEDELYHYIDTSGDVGYGKNNKGNDFDDKCYNNGNYFTSSSVAQAKVDQCLGLTSRIQAYILEENEKANWVARWDDASQKKYCIHYSHKYKKYDYDYVTTQQEIGIVYTSYKIIEELVDKLNDNYR